MKALTAMLRRRLHAAMIFVVITLVAGCNSPMRTAKPSLRQGSSPKIYTFEDVVSKSKAEPFKPSFPLPTEEERPIEPLPDEYIAGTWKINQYTDKIIFLTDYRNIETYYLPDKNPQRQIEIQYEFFQDGTYTFRLAYNGSDTPFATQKGRYSVQDDILTLTPTCGSEAVEVSGVRYKCLVVSQKYKIVWFSPNEISLWRSDKDRIEYRNTDAQRNAVYKNERAWAESVLDKFGCEWLDIYKRGDDGAAVTKMVFTPGHLIRISAMPEGRTRKVAYRLVSCTRESGNDFAYRFSLELQGAIENPLQAFREVQKEFRKEIAKDYFESYRGAEKQSLRVDFTEYDWKAGKIEGRAVVLSISVASLTYDPNTRTGKLAVKVNANQYEEARAYVRKNIETLARDKNIALVTGEIPPAAKFYLGREEIRDGNILEIEFKTE